MAATGEARRRMDRLAGRERQVFRALQRLGPGIVHLVASLLPDPPGYSVLRSTIGQLERKGPLRLNRRGAAQGYMVSDPVAARRAAVQKWLRSRCGSKLRLAASALISKAIRRGHEKEVGAIASVLVGSVALVCE